MDRPPFYSEHNCICAYPDQPILNFYKGYFEGVYIMLSPFEKVDSKENHLEYVSWNEFLRLSGFKLDIALRNAILGLGKQHQNDKDVEILKTTCEKYGLIIPGEGCFQSALKKNMLQSLQEQGHLYMFIGDEYGFERKVAYVQDMIDETAKVELEYPGHENWYTARHQILFATHRDSFYTLLYSGRKTVENILSMHPFEGFHCNDKTTIYWSLQN